MKDSNVNDFDPCPGETRKGPVIMRRNAARFIEKQLEWKTKESRECYFLHYGVMELRELLDYIYGGEPNNEDEKIKSKGGFGAGMGFHD